MAGSGKGVGAAKNLSRIFCLIASKEVRDIKVRSANDASKTRATEARRPQPNLKREVGEVNEPTPMNRPPAPEPTVTVLRYFLDRGRLAELRVPPDMDDREKRRLFVHLKIDLLDEVNE